MRNTTSHLAIVSVIILLSACASNKNTTSVNNEYGANNQTQEKHAQRSSDTDKNKRAINSISDDDYDRY